MSEQMGMMYLSAVLKKYNHSTGMINTDLEDINKKMKEFRPDILAYYSMTGEHRHLIEFNKSLKRKYRFLAVFGGPHPTFFPEVIQNEGIDIIGVGECESAMAELANALEKGRPIDKIKNLWIKKKGRIIKNPVRPLETDLDKLPHPDREIMYLGDKRLLEFGKKVFLAGRGCPYNCTYCFNHKMRELYKSWGRVRWKSVDKLIDEIVEVKNKYPLEFVKFGDDTFSMASREWIEEFAEKYPKKVGIPFGCNLRPNLVTGHFVRNLKKAGCYHAFMAIEAADEKIRNDLLKRNISEEQIAKAYRLLKSAGIKIGYYNLLGLPVKNALKKDIETLKINAKYRPNMAWSSLFTPYPKTELGEYAIKHGYFHGDFEKIPANNKITSCLKFSSLKEKHQIENLHKLFGITVRFPFLLPVTKILIQLPPNRFYTFLMFGFYGLVREGTMATMKLTPAKMLKFTKVLLKHTRNE
ncbi:B12-binding domain-containing radical SAM protein [Candidatus Woesearchaeota archaeon]|nr:B12-binding domain-containing radical SAM protein [Candidatus Woesearchaeota archaeon]